MEDNKTTLSLPMMQANLTEKAVVLTRIGEVEGFASRYYPFDKALFFLCGPVDVGINEDTPNAQELYDNAMKALTSMIDSARAKAHLVLELIGPDTNAI